MKGQTMQEYLLNEVLVEVKEHIERLELLNEMQDSLIEELMERLFVADLKVKLLEHILDMKSGDSNE